MKFFLYCIILHNPIITSFVEYEILYFNENFSYSALLLWKVWLFNIIMFKPSSEFLKKFYFLFVKVFSFFLSVNFIHFVNHISLRLKESQTLDVKRKKFICTFITWTHTNFDYILRIISKVKTKSLKFL